MTRGFTVVDPGPLTTVQDRGRPGWAHLGVPRSGALDQDASALANRLVGNDPAAAVLETTLGGVAIRLRTALSLAVTGARAAVSLDGRRVALAEPVTAHAGQTLVVGPAEQGVRSYVGLGGGIDVAPVLGSRAHDTLSGIGPRPLVRGEEVPVAPTSAPPVGVDVPAPRSEEDGAIGFTAGPREDWFTAGALQTLVRSRYAVAEDSNRVGLRLRGPALGRSRAQELPSEGIVLGAIQVPASGRPLVFLRDHPTTGGYPVIGVVVGEDLSRCAQLRPGETVRFAPRRRPSPSRS